MTEVCLVGKAGVDLRPELTAYETARAALSAYEVTAPYANALAIETISLGTAVSLLGDLDWYLARLVEDALVREPSVSETEWLSRALAEEVRDGRADPAETVTHCRVYGVADGRLVEPMYVARTGGGVPEYDLRDVEETVVVRVTHREFTSG